MLLNDETLSIEANKRAAMLLIHDLVINQNSRLIQIFYGSDSYSPLNESSQLNQLIQAATDQGIKFLVLPADDGEQQLLDRFRVRELVENDAPSCSRFILTMENSKLLLSDLRPVSRKVVEHLEGSNPANAKSTKSIFRGMVAFIEKLLRNAPTESEAMLTEHIRSELQQLEEEDTMHPLEVNLDYVWRELDSAAVHVAQACRNDVEASNAAKQSLTVPQEEVISGFMRVSQMHASPKKHGSRRDV